MNNNGFDPNLNGTYNNNTENAAIHMRQIVQDRLQTTAAPQAPITAAVPKSRTITAHPIRRAERDSTEPVSRRDRTATLPLAATRQRRRHRSIQATPRPEELRVETAAAVRITTPLR